MFFVRHIRAPASPTVSSCPWGAAIRDAQTATRNRPPVRRPRWQPVAALAAVPAFAVAIIAAGIAGGFGLGSTGSTGSLSPQVASLSPAPDSRAEFDVHSSAAYDAPRTIRVTYTMTRIPDVEDILRAKPCGRFSEVKCHELGVPTRAGSSQGYGGGRRLTRVACRARAATQSPYIATACFRLARQVARQRSHSILLAAPLSALALTGQTASRGASPPAKQHLFHLPSSPLLNRPGRPSESCTGGGPLLVLDRCD